MKAALAKVPPEQLLRLDSQVCFQLYAASNLVTRLYRPLLAPLGLTYPQYLVMLVLWESGPVTVRALCDRLLLESGTVSPLLKRLLQRKLVKKTVDPADARRVVVSLTPKGDALRTPAADVPRTLACQLLAQGGPDAAAPILALHRQLKPLVAAWSANAKHTEPE